MSEAGAPAESPSTSADPRRALLVVLLAHPAWVVGAWLGGGGPVWLPMGLTATLVGAGAVWASRPDTVGRLPPRPGPVVIGLLAGGALSLASHLLWPVVAAAMPPLIAEVDSLYARLERGEGPLVALPVFVLIILVEDIFWRGLVQSEIEQRWGMVPAFVVTPVLYAVAQSGQGSALLVAVALLVGTVFTALRAYTKELWAPFLCHLVWDLLVLVFVPLSP